MKDRWSRRLYNDSVILIGLPDHITCGFLHETGSSYTLEYFDPAGKDGDRANIKKLRLVFLNYVLRIFKDPYIMYDIFAKL